MSLRKLWLPAGLALSLGALAAATQPPQPQVLPAPFPEGRYHEMSAKSPFAVATAQAAATAAPTPGFAAELYVDGVSHIGKDDFAAIKSRDPDKPTPLFLAVGASGTDGMKVDAVHWSDDMAKTTVDVSKNGEKATLVFDQAQLAKNANSAPPPAGGMPGIRLPARPGEIRLPGYPGAGIPAGPGFNRTFPQPGQVNPGMPNVTDMRRRIRGIQSGQ
jgi:hypothetical protein